MLNNNSVYSTSFLFVVIKVERLCTICTVLVGSLFKTLCSKVIWSSTEIIFHFLQLKKKISFSNIILRLENKALSNWTNANLGNRTLSIHCLHNCLILYLMKLLFHGFVTFPWISELQVVCLGKPFRLNLCCRSDFRVCPVQPGREGRLSLEAAQGWGQAGSDQLPPQSVLDPIRTQEPLSTHPENNSGGINHNEICAGSHSVLLGCLVKETSLNTGEDLLSKEFCV